jgi:hypothetical protein
MNTTTYPRRTYSSSHTQESHSNHSHPAQEAVESVISQFEGDYGLKATFTRDTASMALFKRQNSVVVAYTCRLFDSQGRCLSEGRGLSFVSYQTGRYVQKAILYARNASLIDCVARASRLSTVFATDDNESAVASSPKGSIPAEQQPSEKQVKYLKNLIETLPSDEQNELLIQLPQMSKFEVSQLINNLKE